MKEILFVCTGNTCRSAMAEALFNSAARQKSKENLINAKSCGLSALKNQPAAENAIFALQEMGIDLYPHLSKPATKEMLCSAHRIFVMTEDHKATLITVFPNCKDKISVLHISDPYGQSLEVYKDCRDTMIKQIDKILLEELD